MPENHAVHFDWAGMEKADERQRERGPSAGSRKGTTGRQRPPGGSRSSSETASALVPDLGSAYHDQLDEVRGAYPGLRVWQEPGGLWLLCSSGLIQESPVTAKFLMAIPHDGRIPKAWAFWNDGTWIGPRHTNFPDGSICCMHDPDGTWLPGDSIVDLLNIYTLWAVRHLHVRLFGRWPGRQVALLRHERLTEISDDEYCGCGSLVEYAECCKKKDLQHSKLTTAIEFALYGSDRSPPTEIRRAANGQANPPPMSEVTLYVAANSRI